MIPAGRVAGGSIHRTLPGILPVFLMLALAGCEESTNAAYTDKRPSNINNYSEKRSFPAVWDDLVEAREEHLPGASFCLNASADLDELVQVQREVGQTFPEDVRELYLYADGQSPGEGCLPLFGEGYWFLSLDEVRSRWQMRLDEHQGRMAMEALYGRQGAVYGYEWHPAWIPLAARDHNDELALDFVPTPMGASGQIIRYLDQHRDRDHMALGLRDYLGQLERQFSQEAVFPGMSRDDEQD